MLCRVIVEQNRSKSRSYELACLAAAAAQASMPIRVAPTPTPPLDAEKKVSVAIIGGGFRAVHGAASGRAGCRRGCWRRSSWAGAHRATMEGQVNPGLKHDPDQIEADFGADLGGRMIAFAYGTTNYFRPDPRYQISCEARQNAARGLHEGKRGAIESTVYPARHAGDAAEPRADARDDRAPTAISAPCWTIAAATCIR